MVIFQLVSEGHTHDLQRSHRESRRKKTVSIWGISNTLNRMWKGAGRGHIHSNGRGPRRRQSIHVSHVRILNMYKVNPYAPT